MFIALSMAELGSAAPTSGGLYYWTFKFSPPKWRNFLAWIVGCKFDQNSKRQSVFIPIRNADYNTIENISAIASTDWGCAVQITAAVSIGSGLKFQATAAQTLSVSFTLFSKDILIISHFVLQWCILCCPSVSRSALYYQSGRHGTVAVGLHGSQRLVRIHLHGWSIICLTLLLVWLLHLSLPSPPLLQRSSEIPRGTFLVISLIVS
jgi:amino acid transporter